MGKHSKLQDQQVYRKSREAKWLEQVTGNGS